MGFRWIWRIVARVVRAVCIFCFGFPVLSWENRVEGLGVMVSEYGAPVMKYKRTEG